MYVCNSIMQLHEESSACTKTQTNSEHSSVLGVLCYYGFIIVIIIFALSFDHKFIREYWCWIVVWLFLRVSFDIADLCIGGCIIQSRSATMDSAGDCCQTIHCNALKAAASISSTSPEMLISTVFSFVTLIIGNVGE